MAHNPGGDEGDGSVGLPFCPYCRKRRLFFDYDEMVSHVAQHEGGKVRKDIELEKLLKGKI